MTWTLLNTPEARTGGPAIGFATAGAADKVLVVFSAIVESDRALRLIDISRVTGLPKSTVHRLVARLVSHKMVVAHHGRYRARPGLLSEARVRYNDLLSQAAMPRLVGLQRATGAAVALSVLDCCEVQNVACVQGTVPGVPWRGQHERTPAITSVAGRLLLAYTTPDANSCPGTQATSTESTKALTWRLREIRKAGFERSDGKAVDGLTLATCVVAGNGDDAPVALSLHFQAAQAGSISHIPLLRRQASIVAEEIRRTADQWLGLPS